jgi:lipopolysaccharide/colanic/teichoic acid biosynthesis glycosyltransferase
MLSAERRSRWLLAGEAEVPQALSSLLARAPSRVVRADAVTDSPQPLPRRGFLVVSDQALQNPRTCEDLVRRSLSGVRVIRPRDYYERVLRRVYLEDLDETWFLFDRPLRRRRMYEAAKALIDFVAGALGSLLAVLLLPVVWLLGKLEGGGPVFYRQERVGRYGRPLTIWKFRTMRVDAERDGPVWASPDDDRVTRVGRVLRATHLDELPQFFNVLRGEMSLVGPRPERPVFVRLLNRAIPFFDRRHLMRPGITGWAVVRFGYSDSVRDKWIIHEHDLYYLKHRSLSLDFEIVVRTILSMALGRGQ